jgi:ferric-dicitrate binding protein FerR (iron transport regulator)
VRRWRAANPEAAREANRGRYSANSEAHREANRRWRAANPEAHREANRRWYSANSETAREAMRKDARRRHAGNREAVLDHYGRACVCCGSTEKLTIDHVNGDGAEHREQIGHGSTVLYRWLVASGFPEGFRVMCMPCNASKRDGTRCRLDHQAADAA